MRIDSSGLKQREAKEENVRPKGEWLTWCSSVPSLLIPVASHNWFLGDPLGGPTPRSKGGAGPDPPVAASVATSHWLPPGTLPSRSLIGR